MKDSFGVELRTSLVTLYRMSIQMNLGSCFPLGLITSFAVHHSQCWLAVGTSSGTHVCWDMRFQLPINSIAHPTGKYRPTVGYLHVYQLYGLTSEIL